MPKYRCLRHIGFRNVPLVSKHEYGKEGCENVAKSAQTIPRAMSWRQQVHNALEKISSGLPVDFHGVVTVDSPVSKGA